MAFFLSVLLAWLHLAYLLQNSIIPVKRTNFMSNKNKLDQLSVNTIRVLSMDAVQAANSGHPGMPMGMADAAYVLWSKFLKHNPKNPNWFNRDRFILSAGHGSMLLYSLLHLTGYDLSLEELKNFRQYGSQTPGHPEFGSTPGVETTTGPLGQGFATGVGMAIAETFLAEKFNRDNFELVDHYTYAIVSDGDLMEGISHEAASLAGHLKLGKLIYLYDSNRISIDGSTDLSFTDNTRMRFEAYGWHVLTVDGHNHEEIEEAIREAQNSDKPSLIECKTKIGYGSPAKEGTADSHGAPLGDDEIIATKKNLEFPSTEKFFIPEEVRISMQEAVERGELLEGEWNKQISDYKNEHPEAYNNFNSYIKRELPENLDEILPVFEADGKGMASRKASGKVLNSIAGKIPSLIGGSADLTGSNNTNLEGEGIYSAGNRTGRNLHYGVREHAMAAAMNGMALHGGLIPFGGTFLVFSDYNKPAIRIAALSKIPTLFVFTHDSIGLGEDGPTHQPVEHLAALRAIPNVHVLRPADANEVSYCWKSAISRVDGPSVMVLTRQALPTIDREKYGKADGAEKGAYIIKQEQTGSPDVILIATGSEVYPSLLAANILESNDVSVRVVSAPSLEIFSQQDDEYKESVLPVDVTNRVSIEAGSTFGWHKWVGSSGLTIGLDEFGISAPYAQAFDHFGITPDKIAKKAADHFNF
jgi:transketolase